MQIQLIDNGLNYIVRAAYNLRFDDELSEEDQMKYSTIDLYEGIELLLKARLAQEHWCLIVKDLDKYNVKSFENGNFVSVNFDTICERLNSFCNIQLKPSTRQAFDKLRKLRNRYIHFICAETYSTVISIQTKAWHHMLEMFEHGFLKWLTIEQQDTFNSACELIYNSDKFLDMRYNEVLHQIKQMVLEGWLVATCPVCEKKSLLFGKKFSSCLVCDVKKIESTEAAEEYTSYIGTINGRNYEIGLCPKCKLKTVIPIGIDLVEQVQEFLLRNGQFPIEIDTSKICFCCGFIVTK